MRLGNIGRANSHFRLAHRPGFGLGQHIAQLGMYFIGGVIHARAPGFFARSQAAGNELGPIATAVDFVQRLIDEGKLTEEAAAVHPQSNLLTGCLGTEQDPPVALLCAIVLPIRPWPIRDMAAGLM